MSLIAQESTPPEPAPPDATGQPAPENTPVDMSSVNTDNLDTIIVAAIIPMIVIALVFAGWLWWKSYEPRRLQFSPPLPELPGEWLTRSDVAYLLKHFYDSSWRAKYAKKTRDPKRWHDAVETSGAVLRTIADPISYEQIFHPTHLSMPDIGVVPEAPALLGVRIHPANPDVIQIACEELINGYTAASYGLEVYSLSAAFGCLVEVMSTYPGRFVLRVDLSRRMVPRGMVPDPVVVDDESARG